MAMTPASYPSDKPNYEGFVIVGGVSRRAKAVPVTLAGKPVIVEGEPTAPEVRPAGLGKPMREWFRPRPRKKGKR